MAFLDDMPEWVDEVHEEGLHPTCNPRWYLGGKSSDRAVRYYNVAVMSLIFDALDNGLPPYPKEIAMALNDAGVSTSEGNEWSGKLVSMRLSHSGYIDDVVAYRHGGNYAHLVRIGEEGKHRIRVCKLPA